MKASKRFYARRATQRHQMVPAEIVLARLDNLTDTIRFGIQQNSGPYIKVDLSPDEAKELANTLLRFVAKAEGGAQ